MAKAPNDDDFYGLLGIQRRATAAEIQKAFRLRAKSAHPDKTGGTEEWMKNLNKAKITLLDPERRAKYDDKYEPEDDIHAAFATLNIGERLSDDFQRRLDGWNREFSHLKFIDNFENGEMYDDVFEEIQQVGKDLLKIDAEFRNAKPQVPSEENAGEKTFKVIRFWLIAFCANVDGILKKIADRLCENANIFIKPLYDELSMGQDITKLPLRYQLLLLIFKGYYLEQEKDYKASLQAYQDAMILLPTEEVHSTCTVASLLNINHIKAMIAGLTEQLKESDVPIPVSHQYADRLESNINIRMAKKYEKAVHSGGGSNMSAALLYLDFCMSSFDTSMVCSNFMLASAFFLREMKQFEFVRKRESNQEVALLDTDRVPLSLMYALRNAIRDLCFATAIKARKHEQPMTELYFVKLSFILHKLSTELFREALIASNQLNLPNANKSVIEDADKELTERLSRSLTRLVKVVPFANIPMVLSTDFIFLGLVGTNFLDAYYNANTVDNPRSHKYQYELLELAWKRLYSDDGLKFQSYRHEAIIALLKQNPLWDINQVHSLMQWSVLNRDEEGFLDPNRPWLNLPGENFDSVDGVVIDLETGVFQLLLTPTSQSGQNEDKMERTGLFNMADVCEVLKMGITSSCFSLDQVDFDMQAHPFQEMRFNPSKCFNSNFLATQLHADMLLKYLSTGVEVSAKFPFAFRPTADQLVKTLPEPLRDFVLPTSDRENGTHVGQAHRFWIQCGELTFDANQKENDLIHLFGKCPMEVKTHIMKYSAKGELIDADDSEKAFDDDGSEWADSDGTESDDDLDSDEDYGDSNCGKDCSEYKFPEVNAEKEFADDLTRSYTYVGRYYRVLLRLRELYKLQAVCKILRRLYDNLEESKKTCCIDITPIQASMDNVYSQVKGATIRECDITDVSSKIVEAFGVPNDSVLKSLVTRCLRDGQCVQLAQHIRTDLEMRKKERMSRFGIYCNRCSLNFNNPEKNDVNDPNGSDCVWVPSAFYRNSSKRVYGGVNMNLRMNMHTPVGTNGNASAFNSSAFRSLAANVGYFDSGKFTSHISERASVIADSSFTGNLPRNFRIKSGAGASGGSGASGGAGGSGSGGGGNGNGKGSKDSTRGTGRTDKPKIHKIKARTRKRAYDIAKKLGGGLEPILHWDPLVGWHYHIVSKQKTRDVKSGKFTADLRMSGQKVTHKGRHSFPKDESKHGQTGGVHVCFDAPNPPGQARVRTHKELEKLRQLNKME